MPDERRLVLAFEGQGARSIPSDHHSAICRLVNGMDSGESLRDVAAMPPSIAQQAILAHQLCQASAFAKDGRVVAVIGQSLGELAAFAVAGALSVTDTMTLARLRAELPATVLGAREWAMLSLTRVPAARVEDAAQEVGGWLVAHNGPIDTVVVIESARLSSFLRCVQADENTYRALPVRFPYHTPAMRPVADALAVSLMNFEIRDPVIPVVSPTGPLQPTTADEVREIIAGALTVPVHWSKALSWAAARWTDAAWRECGPANVLYRFVWKNKLKLDWSAAA